MDTMSIESNMYDENIKLTIKFIENLVGSNVKVKLNPTALMWSPAPQNPEDQYIPIPMNNVTNVANVLTSVLPSGATIQEKTKTKPRTRKSKK